MSDSMTDYSGSFKVTDDRLFKDFDTGEGGGKGVRLHSTESITAQFWAKVKGSRIHIETQGGEKSRRTVDRKDLEAFLHRQGFLPEGTKGKISDKVLRAAYREFLDSRQIRMSGTGFQSLLSELEDAGFEVPAVISQAVKGHGQREVAFSLKDFAGLLSTSKQNGTSVLLYAACLRGNVAAVKSLLKMKADPNIVDIRGRSPLHVACQRGHHELLAPLMAGKANPFMTDKSYVGPAQCIDAKKFPLLTKVWFEALKSSKEQIGPLLGRREEKVAQPPPRPPSASTT